MVIIIENGTLLIGLLGGVDKMMQVTVLDTMIVRGLRTARDLRGHLVYRTQFMEEKDEAQRRAACPKPQSGLLPPAPTQRHLDEAWKRPSF